MKRSLSAWRIKKMKPNWKIMMRDVRTWLIDKLYWDGLLKLRDGREPIDYYFVGERKNMDNEDLTLQFRRGGWPDIDIIIKSKINQ